MAFISMDIERNAARTRTLHVPDIVVRRTARWSHLLEDLSAQLLCDLGVLGQLVDSKGQGTRRRVATGDEEVDELVGEDAAVCTNLVSGRKEKGLKGKGIARYGDERIEGIRRGKQRAFTHTYPAYS